jgi:hypothetical protein
MLKSVSNLRVMISVDSLNFFTCDLRSSSSSHESFLSFYALRELSRYSAHSFSLFLISFFKEANFSLNFYAWFLISNSRLPNILLSLNISSFICEFYLSSESILE